MGTFGPGDYGGYNDWAFSGGNTFWTNWNTSTFGTGTVGRVTAIAARWDYYTGFCGAASGHNDIWNTGTSLVASTGNFAANGAGAGTTATMNNFGCSDVWQSNASYYIGFSRGQSQCSIFSWKDNSNGGYAGKSAGDGNNGSGTANWGGTTNGGLPVYGTVTPSNIYVKRAGAWSQVFVDTKRAGTWSGPVYVYVKRAGTWNIINRLKEIEIPHNGLPILVDIGEGIESGLLVEDGEKSWFGSIDPTTQSWDWTKEGQFKWESRPWTGRYNSFESNAIAEQRLEAMYEWDQALRWEDYQRAKLWWPKFQPSGLPEISRKSTVVPEIPESDPEPILVGCNCGG